MANAIFPAALQDRRLPNLFDVVALLALFALFAALGGAARSTLQPLGAAAAAT